jgi:hypothetical protein
MRVGTFPTNRWETIKQLRVSAYVSDQTREKMRLLAGWGVRFPPNWRRR